MRELILDTETTGLHADRGDRIIEVAAIELLDRSQRGKSFQQYVNPGREITADAEAVHGISSAMLRDKPEFGDIVEAFLAFIGDDPLVIHNAPFDLGFLNAELARCGRPPLPASRAVDTLELARRRHPGARNSLDRLAERYRIDTSARSLHGGLVDAGILLEVYLELTDSRQQQDLGMDEWLVDAGDGDTGPARQRPRPLPPRSSAAEREAHRAHLQASIGAHAIWFRLAADPAGTG